MDMVVENDEQRMLAQLKRRLMQGISKGLLYGCFF